MSRIIPVILAGGSGTRLWPASRSMYPKQLLPIAGETTMLQQTATRLDEGGLDLADPMVICNEAHRFLVSEQLRTVGKDARVVLEPVGRNTAPAATLAALLAMEATSNGDAPLLLVMPADHVIDDKAAFAAAIQTGAASAAEGNLVCFGIVPTYAATGYGYIESGAAPGKPAPVDSFVEKPDKDTAENLISQKRYFWNAGIFLMRADVWLEELGRHAPAMLEAVKKSVEDGERTPDFWRPNEELFSGCPSDSIDYAVMEHTARGVVVPLDAGWNDVGSWSAVHDVSAADDDGNSVEGDVLTIDCAKTLVRSKSRLVAAVGVENLIIVEDKDTVLVTTRDRSQDVKKLVDELKSLGREEPKLHRQVFRPWGSYDSIDADDGFQVKRLIVKPGAVLSLQKHAHRAEHWVCVRGTARITRNDEEFDLEPNESTYIAIGDIHRIANRGDEDVHIIEVQCGDYLGEDDIVRIEDNYGRAGTNT